MPDDPPQHLRRLRVFLASPNDVAEERNAVDRILAKLKEDYANSLDIEVVRWEREPLLTTAGYQTQIPLPSESDVVLVVVWNKLGRLLPLDRFPGPLSGGQVTGTQWEFEEALKAARDRGQPKVLFYRRKPRITADPADIAAVREQMAGMERVETFLAHWFPEGKDQPAKAARHSYTDPAEFEDLCAAHLRKLIAQRLDQARPARAEVAPPGQIWTGPPFRGLRSFELEQAPIFFGRDRARAEVRALLARQSQRGVAFVMVLGASGSGKSSLVKAGVLADLRAGLLPPVTLCRHAILRPSDGGAAPEGEPLIGLTAALTRDTALPELAWDQAKLLETLRHNPYAAIAPLANALAEVARQARHNGPDRVRLALVVDQFEELFTDEKLAPEARARFVAALEVLAGSGLVWVVATLRSDFFDRIETLPVLARLSAGEGKYLLLPPDAAELDQIIREPARAAGLVFDPDPATGQPLSEILRAETLAAPESLPLLSDLLEQLWERRERRGQDDHLTPAAYHALGGLQGALGRRAEAVFTALPQDLQEALPSLLRALTTIGQDKSARAAARWAPKSQFPPGSPPRRLAEAFLATDAHLLIADGDGDGAAAARVRVIHEALFSHWSRAKAQIQMERADLQLSSRLQTLVLEWTEADAAAKPDHLLHGSFLARAEDLRDRWREDLSEPVRALITASATARREQEDRKQAEERRRIELEQAVERQRAEAEKKRLESEAAHAQALAETAQRQRLWAGIAAAVLLVLALFGWAEWRAAEAALQHARIQEQAAKASLAAARLNQAHYLTEKAQAAFKDGFRERAGLIALAGLPMRLPTATHPLHPPLSNHLAEWVQNDPLHTVLIGHEAGVSNIAFSPDGTRIVTASFDKTARIWDVATGRPLTTLAGHKSDVNSAAFSPDGERIVTASSDNTAKVWDAANGMLLITLSGHKNEVTSAAFSPDGKRIVTASRSKTARIWDAATGRRLIILKGHENVVASAAFSLDGARIVTASWDKTARIWDAARGQPLTTLTGHEAAISSAAFSPDGTRIVTASEDKTARIWDGNTGKHLLTLTGHTGAVTSASFSPDGTHVVTTSEDGITGIWDAATGRRIALLDGHINGATFAAFSPTGTRLATASVSGTARIWFLAAKAPHEVLFRQNSLAFLAISLDGRRIVSASDDKNAQIWDAATGKTLTTLTGHGEAISSAAFSPDGTRIVTVSGDQTTRIWDTAGGKLLTTLTGYKELIISAIFSPDGTRIVTASFGDTARIWDVASGKTLITISDNEPLLRAAAFSPDGRSIATASWGNDVQIRNSVTGNRTVNIHEENVSMDDVLSGSMAFSIMDSATFSPDGTRIVAALWNKTARIWDAASGKTLTVLVGHAGAVQSAAFSRDGALVLTTSEDNTARLWDARWGVTLAVFDDARHAVFDPAGPRLFVASKEGKVRVEPLPAVRSAAELLAAARLRAPRTLTAEERKAVFLDEGEEEDPVFGTLKPSGDPDHHRRLAEGFENGTGGGRPDWPQALFHHALAARLYALKGDTEQTAVETARRATISRMLPQPEVAAVWQKLWTAAGGVAEP